MMLTGTMLTRVTHSLVSGNCKSLLMPYEIISTKIIGSCRAGYSDDGDTHKVSVTDSETGTKAKYCRRNLHRSLQPQFSNTYPLTNKMVQARKPHLVNQEFLQCTHSFSVLSSSKRIMSLKSPSPQNILGSIPNVKQIQHNRGIWDIFQRANFGSYTVLDDVGEVSATREVPSHIPCPPYAQTGEPSSAPSSPEIKANYQVQAMKESCYLARSILNIVGENIQVGMTTDDIDKLVHTKIIASGAYPSPLNYLGFPKSVCTSVNNVACHGIPDDRHLLDGDIVSVDVTVFYNGYHGDCCETYLIGNVDEAGRHLVEAARRCRDAAVSICAPGVPFAAIGTKVKEVAIQGGVTVVPCFIGHGIGQYFHGPPDIYHCYNDYPGCMEAGMTFTIEPIVAQGKEDALILEDGWTAVMLDNGRAAQFEHTILVTESGHEILTDYH
ncbi:methionine aminopeptidase 1D, mitochondrial isoform X1 [Procambarus clarkii]|uniref:methionine aminopeptidase 1D, mitochondrial isoform X1 n=2 Tax=Procambarus clarkii TaxID=6728 RepID=UPI0037426D0D